MLVFQADSAQNVFGSWTHWGAYITSQKPLTGFRGRAKGREGQEAGKRVVEGGKDTIR